MSVASSVGQGCVATLLAVPVANAQPAEVPAALTTSPDPAAEPVPGAPAAAPRPRGPARVRASANEGFGLDSADGRFGLSFGILGQMRYAVDEDAGTDHGFSIRLARPMIQGHVWDRRVVWQIQTEFAGQARLLDANAIINIHPAFAILAGQYRPWFTRGFPTNLPLQALPDRGPVLDSFRVDRDIGVTFLGHPFDGRMEYYVGVLNGEGVSLSGPRNPQPLLTARLVGAPLGGLGYSQTTAATAKTNLPFRFAFAANAATNEVSREGINPGTGAVIPLPDLRTVVVGGDIAVQGWRITALAEGFWRSNRQQDVDASEEWGTYGQISGVVVRKRLEVTARVGAMRLELDLRAHVPVEPGINLYVFGNHAKLQLRYRCDIDPSDGDCRSQGGDVQAQLWF